MAPDRGTDRPRKRATGTAARASPAREGADRDPAALYRSRTIPPDHPVKIGRVYPSPGLPSSMGPRLFDVAALLRVPIAPCTTEERSISPPLPDDGGNPRQKGIGA